MDDARESPKKRGQGGGMCNDDFKILVTAFDSYVKIKQVHAETSGNNRNPLTPCMNDAMDLSWKSRMSQHFKI